MSEMDAIVQRIKSVMEKNDINGIMLGDLLGLRKSPLTDWKNGKSRPTLEQIMTICNRLSVSPDYLLFGKRKDLTLSENEAELLENYRELDSRGKHRLHTIVYEELDRYYNSRS